MGLNLPRSAVEVVQRSKTDVQRSLPDSNPFLPNSVLGAIVTGNANSVFDFYLQLDLLQNILMPDTTDEEFAQRWAAIYGKTLLPATIGTGFIVATGVAGTTVTTGLIYVRDNVEYQVQTDVDITNNVTAISVLSRVGSTVTALCATPHNLSNNVETTISAASAPEYNGTYDIIVVDEFTFTYEIEGTPTTPDIGSPEASYTSALVEVNSLQFQDSAEDVYVNLTVGEIASLQSPVVDLDNEAGAYFAGVSGGTDQESFASLRDRTLDKIQNPVAHYNAADIIEKAKEVAGVTRVFVFEVTPALGEVTINFMRDNDVDPIPDAGEVTTVKDAILTITPANTAEGNVYVDAPVAVPTDFTFTAITPSTAAMENAVVASLTQFFAEETEVGEDIDEDAYRAAIINTIDSDGNKVSTFTLSSPSGDIAIATGEIGTLGVVSFP